MNTELKDLIADLLNKVTDADLLDLIYKLILECTPDISI